MSVAARITAAAARHADREALWVAGRTVRYAQLQRWSDALMRSLGERARIVAVIGPRRVPTYAAIFACLADGRAYVPLSPGWPVDRILRILAQARPDAVVLAEGCPPDLAAAIAAARVAGRIATLALDGDDLRVAPVEGDTDETRSPSADDLAYVMFTSGSTGSSKGVPIAQRSLVAYHDNMQALAAIGADDRIAQTVEITFDLSVHDMVLAWSAGAMLAVVPEASAALTPRFVRQLKLTSTLLVPSTAAQAAGHRLLAPGAMPTLRTGFFCGEALPTSVAEAWRAAAPNARAFNIYGPTEATIAFSAFEFTGGAPAGDVVPLGRPLGAERMAIGEEGEILLSGAQVFSGYLGDAEKTAAALIRREGATWYRTGDRGAFDPEHGYVFRGRMDAQIKLRGYRVELGDIEAALREASGSALVAAVPHDATGPSTFDAVSAFVADCPVDEDTLLKRLRERLPAYMMPARTVMLAAMPKNSNDKIDGLALARMLDAG